MAGGGKKGSASPTGGTPFEGGLSPSTPSLFLGRLYGGDSSSIRWPRRRRFLSLASLLTSGASRGPTLFWLFLGMVFSWPGFLVVDAQERQIQVPLIDRSGTLAGGAAWLGVHRSEGRVAVLRWRGER